MEINNLTMKQLNNLGHNGFTLIELLVVSGIIMVIIGAVSSSFFSSLKGATKVVILNDAKQNGDYALSVMERMIRNSMGIVTGCPFANQSSITIKNPDGGQTIFACPVASTGPISSNSANLTSPKVAVSSADCYFTCEKTAGSIEHSVVKIYFRIHQSSPSPGVTIRPEGQASVNFETSVSVRNSGF